MVFNLTLNTPEPESSKGSEIAIMLRGLATQLESDHPTIEEEQGGIINTSHGLASGKWSIVCDPEPSPSDGVVDASLETEPELVTH